MNKKILIGIAGLLLGMAMALHSSQVDFPKLTGPYLGQKPPGMTPRILAPGILSRFSMLHGKLVFSPDGLEAFWTCNAAPVQSRWTARQTPQGIWAAPEPSLFSVEYIENSMVYSADGATSFFRGGYPTNRGYTDSQYYWVDTKIIESLRPSIRMPGEQLEIN